MRVRNKKPYCTSRFPTYSIPLPPPGSRGSPGSRGYDRVPDLPKYELERKIIGYKKRYALKNKIDPSKLKIQKQERRIRSTYNRSAKRLVLEGIYEKTPSGLTRDKLIKSKKSGKYTTKTKSKQKPNSWLRACALAREEIGIKKECRMLNKKTDYYKKAVEIKNKMTNEGAYMMKTGIIVKDVRYK